MKIWPVATTVAATFAVGWTIAAFVTGSLEENRAPRQAAAAAPAPAAPIAPVPSSGPTDVASEAIESVASEVAQLRGALADVLAALDDLAERPARACADSAPSRARHAGCGTLPGRARPPAGRRRTGAWDSRRARSAGAGR